MAAIVIKEWQRPDRAWLSRFSKFPTSIVSDCLGRYMGMNAEIKRLYDGIHLCGFALTVQSMVGNNIMSHFALTIAKPGDVLVIDAGAGLKNAVWGGVQAICAARRRVQGVVIDGVVRDGAEMRKNRFPVFCRGTTPNGPHKGWADSVNVPIQCGGVPVHPGDLVLGDDDGVVVVPKGEIPSVYDEARSRLKREKGWIAQINKGKSSLSAVGLTETYKKLDVEYR
jgi:4-hydroxy-4-methyl-2-oxoglutarate aldolase